MITAIKCLKTRIISNLKEPKVKSNWIKKTLTVIGTVVGCFAVILLITGLMNTFSAPGVRVVSINVPYLAAFCAPLYFCLNTFVFKEAVTRSYLHVVYFPLAAMLSSLILFYYSHTNQSEGISYFADKIASAPVYYATGAGTLLLFLLISLMKIDKKIQHPVDAA